MSLILHAIAFLPQELLANLTRSPRKCFMCHSPYGVYGIMHGVALPCGFIVEYRQRTPSDMSSAAISCPYCGTDALACNGAGKQDHTAIAALHGAERRLGPEQKAVLRRLLGWEGEGGGVEMGIGKEWRRDEDSYGDGEWELYEDADDFGGGSDGDETAEMSFDEVFEMGL